MEETGLALFVYERPEHTKRVLEGIRRNDPDELYVFADGPAPSDDEGKIQAVREHIDDIDWCTTHVYERSENWGLADSTIDGIETVFEENDRLIMLEDDDVPSPDFLDFMERCLDLYADEERVMNISGYSPPLDVPETYPYDVYFTYRASSWGWATWKDTWEIYDRDPDYLLDQLTAHEDTVREHLRKAGEDIFRMFRSTANGETDSWSIWWTVAIIRWGGLSLNPVRPYVKNIGHDGTGTHSIKTHIYDVSIDEATPVSELNLPTEPFVHGTLNERMNRFWNPTLPMRAKRKAGRLRRRYL
jgi:hypothetical protein